MEGITLKGVEEQIGLIESQMEHLRLSPSSKSIKQALLKRGIKEMIPLLARQIKIEQETMEIYKRKLKELLKLRNDIVEQMRKQARTSRKHK